MINLSKTHKIYTGTVEDFIKILEKFPKTYEIAFCGATEFGIVVDDDDRDVLMDHWDWLSENLIEEQLDFEEWNDDERSLFWDSFEDIDGPGDYTVVKRKDKKYE